jgi:cbb3-type cytochrome oxidase subunit 3
MNKEQLIAYYHRFCRWQHEVPHYVNRHEDTVQHCHNCGTAFSDNFCPRCGQRAEVGRVGWKSLKENIALLWGMDSRSLSYTLFQLLTRPGYLVRDYISGRRQVSFPPVKMLVIVGLFTVIFESVFHLENEVVSIHFNIPEIDNVIKWFNDNKSWGTLFYQIFFILPTWVVFRFAPGYPRHTLPEGFFLQIFVSTQSLLLTFLDYLSADFENVVATIFLIITYRQLFGYSWWGTLWRLIITVLTVLMMILPLFLVAFLFSNDDRKDDVIRAGLWLLAIVILLTAVMLFVTYRISRKKESNYVRTN